MADWYVGSVQHAAVAQFAISTAYSVGNIVRQLAAPAVGSERCFRCTTAGTSAGSEPSWNLGKGSTTTSGTATFTEVTGNSTYGWSAPSARLNLIISTFAAAGDRIFVAHNHAETQATANSMSSQGTELAPIKVLCVNAAGSVPPVAADLATTGTVSTTGASTITLRGGFYVYGLTFSAGDGSSNASILLGAVGAAESGKLENCLLKLNTTSASGRIGFEEGAALTLINTPMQFGSTSQSIQNRNNNRCLWMNTPSAIAGATIPTSLFGGNAGDVGSVTLDGIDLSAMGSGKTIVPARSFAANYNLINCRLDAAVTVAATPTNHGQQTNVIVSASGATGYRQERYTYEGTLTTETTHVRDGGASDGVQDISWKVVTTANVKDTFPFPCFPIAKWNDVVGTPLVATIEIENSGVTLQDGDVWVEIEYLGDGSYPLSSRASSAPATPLTAAANLSTSSVTWSGGLGSAVKQYLQVGFTPQMAGLVRATVFVAKASQTLYIDPKLTLT